MLIYVIYMFIRCYLQLNALDEQHAKPFRFSIGNRINHFGITDSIKSQTTEFQLKSSNFLNILLINRN